MQKKKTFYVEHGLNFNSKTLIHLFKVERSGIRVFQYFLRRINARINVNCRTHVNDVAKSTQIESCLCQTSRSYLIIVFFVLKREIVIKNWMSFNFYTDIREYTNILALFYIYYSFSFKDNFDTTIIICENFV